MFIKREGDELVVLGDGWTHTVGTWYFDVLYVLYVLGVRGDTVGSVDTFLNSVGVTGGKESIIGAGSTDNGIEKNRSSTNGTVNTPYLPNLSPFAKFLAITVLCKSFPFKISFTTHHLLMYTLTSAYVPFRIYTLRSARGSTRARNLDEVVKEVYDRIDVLKYADECTVDSLGVFVKYGYLDDKVIYVCDGDIVVFDCDEEGDEEGEEDGDEDGDEDEEGDEDGEEDGNENEKGDEDEVNVEEDMNEKGDEEEKNGKTSNGMNGKIYNHKTKKVKINTCSTTRTRIKIHIRCREASKSLLILRKRKSTLFVRTAVSGMVVRKVPQYTDERWRTYCDSIEGCCDVLKRCGEENEGAMYLRMIEVIEG